jgi:uncharacterized protein GlcG (DUF336 family)
VAAGLHIASDDGAPVAVVVVDLAGRVVAGARGDQASWVSWEAALRKAVAAASLGVPTHDARAMADDDPVLAKAVDGVEPVLVVPGGFPVRVGESVVGGVGVAGAHYRQDQQIAEKLIAAASSSV